MPMGVSVACKKHWAIMPVCVSVASIKKRRSIRKGQTTSIGENCNGTDHCISSPHHTPFRTESQKLAP